MRSRYWNKAVIAYEIKHLYEIGADLSWTAMRKENGSLLTAAARYFGGWREAVEFAGIDYASVRRVRSWNPERVRRAILDLHAGGADLSLRQMLENKERSCVLHAARFHYGTWKEAVTAAGLEYDEIARQKTWSREEIEQAILHLYIQGEDISSRNMDYNHLSLINAARRLFGNWENAVRHVGLDYEAIRRRRSWSREKIVKSIRQISTEDRKLSGAAAVRLDPALYAAAQKRLHFGGWCKALQESER